VAKVTADTQRQGKRLRALREARGWSKPQLAGRVGFESTQSIDLYEKGISVIRMDQVRTWADAFEMPEVDFVAAVLSDSASWSLESELRDAGVPEWAVQRALQAGHGEPLMIQQWIARNVREMMNSGGLPVNEPPVNDGLAVVFLRQA
jgi:transcriptional regulator with XRE-family HTH domain